MHQIASDYRTRVETTYILEVERRTPRQIAVTTTNEGGDDVRPENEVVDMMYLS